MAKAKASPTQRNRFIEAARAIGTDEDEAAFKEKLGVIARQKPRGEPQEPASDLKPRRGTEKI